MSIEALTQAKSTLEGIRGALGIYSKKEVDMTLGMLDRAIAYNADLDAICQDLQEMTYKQAMRIAELEAKLAEAEKHSATHGEPVGYVSWGYEAVWNGKPPKAETDLYTHPPVPQGHEPKREPLTVEQIDDLHGEANRGFCIEREDYFKAFRDAEVAHGITKEL